MTDHNILFLNLIVGGLIVIGASLVPVLSAFEAKRRLVHRITFSVHAMANQSESRSGPHAQQNVALRSTRTMISLFCFGAGGIALVLMKPFDHWPIVLRLALVAMALYLGYRFPKMQQEKRIETYRKEVERELPSMIDLIIVMMEAGATFDSALSRLTRDKRIPDSPIKAELTRLGDELTIAPDRQIAYQKFSESVDLNDLRLFSSVLLQSELFGTPVAKGLRGLAFEMRQRHFHEVEALGSTLGPKLAIPMTMFFLPVIFIIVLMPALIRSLNLP